MSIGCFPFLVMLIALVAGWFAFGIPGVVFAAVMSFILLNLFRI